MRRAHGQILRNIPDQHAAYCSARFGKLQKVHTISLHPNEGGGVGGVDNLLIII